MSIRIYNTLSKKKEIFQPLTHGKVGIYACGITAYDVCHVGHARSAVVFDVITRYFRYRGYNVTYVKNFTDVDDKIIAKANAEGKSISEISEKYIREHDEDMDALGVARPTVAPRATEHIAGMIKLINILLAKGLAYESDGDIYYAVEKFDGYGKLSGRNLEEMMAGARVDISEKKRYPLDFALWKASKEGEPWWDSPWGRGRPGWHIECSIMSQNLLGGTFDIHGGGEDLIFPHHENEIAQSEGATGKPLARFWVHNGFVKVSSEKMSKSLGNFFTIKDILKSFHPEVVRLFMLQSHYKGPVNFSSESLSEARMGMERFYATLKTIKGLLKDHRDVPAAAAERLAGKDRDIFDRTVSLPDRFRESMDDDFNTPRAIGYIFDTVRLINGYVTDEKFSLSDTTRLVLDKARSVVAEVGGVLGLFLDDPDDYFIKDHDREAGKLGLDVREIERLIKERQSARLAKDWKKADDIRRLLTEKKIVLKDSPSGTEWRIE
jgi:cysteinyl-tRNA synthetase